MTNQVNDRASAGRFALAMLIFGTVGIVRRYIPMSSAFLACVRGLMGGLFLSVLIWARRKGALPKLKARDALCLAATGAMIGINWILLFEAYNHTTVAVATLCYYMEPTIVVLLSPLLFRERLTWKKALCAAVSVGGMALVCGVVGAGPLQGGQLRGILLGLGAAVFYAAVVIMNKRLRGIDGYQRTTLQLLSAGLVMIPYLLVAGGFPTAGVSASDIALIMVLGIVHTGIAYALYFGSMDGLRIQSVAVMSYIDPVSALLLSALFLGEPLTALNVIGACLVIGSAMASELLTDR